MQTIKESVSQLSIVIELLAVPPGYPRHAFIQSACVPCKKTAFRFCVYFQPPCPPGHHGLALTLFSFSFLPCIVKQPCLFFCRGSAVLCDGEYEYILSVKKCQHPIPLFFVFFHFFLFFLIFPSSPAFSIISRFSMSYAEATCAGL